MRTVIFSLDYDGCADILFDDILGNSDFRSCQKYFPELKKTLVEFLFLKSQCSTKPVEVYNFSNRQNALLDSKGADNSQNGLCLPNLANYCSKRGWIFQNGEEVQELEIGRRKTKIFVRHLNDIIKKHPNPKDEVHWYVLDDDGHGHGIFDDLQKYIEKHAIEIPSNIHMYLVKSNWVARLNKSPMIIEFPLMSGRKIVKSDYESGLTTFKEKEEAVVPQVQTTNISKSHSPI